MRHLTSRACFKRSKFIAALPTHLLPLDPDELSFEELGDVDEEGGHEGRSDEDGEVEQRRVARQPHVVLEGVPDNHRHDDGGGNDDDDAHDGDDEACDKCV